MKTNSKAYVIDVMKNKSRALVFGITYEIGSDKNRIGEFYEALTMDDFIGGVQPKTNVLGFCYQLRAFGKAMEVIKAKDELEWIHNQMQICYGKDCKIKIKESSAKSKK